MPYCINRDRDCCSGCAREGQFRHLEPVSLWDWEHFELPPFGDLLGMSSYAKLAIIWLALYFLQQKGQQGP